MPVFETNVYLKTKLLMTEPSSKKCNETKPEGPAAQNVTNLGFQQL